MINDKFGIRLIRLAPFQGLVTELHDSIGRCPMLLLARLSALLGNVGTDVLLKLESLNRDKMINIGMVNRETKGQRPLSNSIGQRPMDGKQLDQTALKGRKQ
ncbi:MAG: hypothetical protein LBT78_09060 [Tannerella sp.]|jgi:hypothetical protein|nr:hypothetical protein [Tannerella sp.]